MTWPPQGGPYPVPPGGGPLPPPRPLPPGPAGWPPAGAPPVQSGPAGPGLPLPPPAAPLPPPQALPLPQTPMTAGFGTPARFDGYRAGRPPKKSKTGLVVLLSVLGVIVLVVGGVALIGVVTHQKSRRVDTASTPVPTYSATAGETSSSQYPTETSTSTTSTSATVETSTEAPAEESEEPPRQSGPRPVKETARNPLFASADAGLQNVACSLSRWASDRDSVERFFQSASRCLDTVWSPVLGDADLPFDSPHLIVASSRQMQSPCTGGTDNYAAFYCPANETIYMPMDKIQLEQYGNHPGVYLALFAHEYGHHVQHLSGVSEAEDEQRYDAGADSDAGLELSRRSELQAQCFSGMFLGASAVAGGSVDRNIYNEAWNSQDRGDHQKGLPRDHGSDAHAESWWQQGATKNRTQQCNTWASNSADVS